MVTVELMVEIWFFDPIRENWAEKLMDKADISNQEDQGYTWKEEIWYLAVECKLKDPSAKSF